MGGRRLRAQGRPAHPARQIAWRPLHSGRWEDEDGTPRLVGPTIGWDGLVRLAFDEIRQAGAASPQISRRLRSALEDLADVAPPERRPAVERQLRLLAELVESTTATGDDRRAAATADPSGLGSADDLLRPAPAGGDGPLR